MIRRQATRDGQPQWLLISQVEHARMAAHLAGPWRAGDLHRFAFHRSLLAAVEHHDDGWAAWDARPEVDPSTGQPRNFTEMWLVDAAAIWRKSIAHCAAIDPFAGSLVSGHFAALIEMVAPLHADDVGWNSLADAFLSEQRRKREAWRSAAGPGEPAWCSAAALGLHWLQFFDQLSLWFCCAERTEPETLAPPAGPAVRLLPEADWVRIDPWPWEARELRLETIAQRVPARRFLSSDELASVSPAADTLTWHLKP